MNSQPYRRPCWVEIDTRAFEHNYRILTAAAGRGALHSPSPELLAIVKADAYGHGLALCAPAAVRAGARWLGVTSVEEGVAARGLCPYPETEVEILVIGGLFPGQAAGVLQHRLTPVVWEPWHLDELESAARQAGCPPQSIPVHLEVDTGMSRQGVSPAGLHQVLPRFGSAGALKLDGLMTHLFAADETDGAVTRKQFALFESTLHTLSSAGVRPTWLNLGNSAALLAAQVPHQLQALASANGMRAMLRPGLALYGLAPGFSPSDPPPAAALRRELRPVLSWKTRVIGMRSIGAGQAVGYNGTFVATEPMRVALLAAGYGDGLKRSLSNRGYVLIGGQRAPIVGRISMDQTVVDVTGVPNIEPGDEGVLLGRQGSERISAEEHAALAATIPWEILTSIAPRVERRATGIQQVVLGNRVEADLP